MKIDGHPFPANMVDVGKKGNALQTKVLMSQSAKESGAVDPKAQMLVESVPGTDGHYNSKGQAHDSSSKCSLSIQCPTNEHYRGYL